MTTVQKNDFIEIEFTGSSNGKVFDTTNKDDAKELNLETEVKPMTISVGNDMILKGLDNELIGKEIGKDYKLSLTPDKAFGKRDPKLLQTIPMRVFREKNIYPEAGMALQLDNQVAKVISVSGGRVTVDFNNPLAGKDVDYKYKILRKVDNNTEKVNSLQDFFFKQRFEFELKDKKVIFKNQAIKQVIDMFSEKFKEITGLEFTVAEEKEKEKADTKDKKQENSEKKQDNVVQKSSNDSNTEKQ